MVGQITVQGSRLVLNGFGGYSEAPEEEILQQSLADGIDRNFMHSTMSEQILTTSGDFGINSTLLEEGLMNST